MIKKLLISSSIILYISILLISISTFNVSTDFSFENNSSFTLNHSIQFVLAQDSSFNNNNNNTIVKNNQEQYFLSPSAINFGYKSQQPFLILNGTDFIDISHNDTLSLQDFAIAAWVNTNQSTTLLAEPAHIVNKGGFNTDEKGENMNYGIWFSVDGTITGGFETESGEDFEVKSTTKYNDGKWHYVLLSYDGSLLRLDIDGEKQISTKNTNGAIPDTTGDQPLRIGANSLDESKFFTGNIDEVRVWNRGLTDKEIAQIYTNNTFNTIGQIIYKDFTKTGVNNDIASLDINKTITNTNTNISTTTTTTNTLLPPDSNFTFNVAGDFRDTPETGYNLISDNPNFIIMTGDYGMKINAMEWTNNMMAMVKNSVSPVYGTVGNHDDDEYLDTGFFINKNWSFSFNAGNIAFVAANTKDENVTETNAFLARAQNDPNVKWIIVFMHESIWHPVGTSVSSDTTIDFHTTFTKYSKVKMVIAGHTHVYARMVPVDGILYIMNGIGGQEPSKGSTQPSTFSKINGALHCNVTSEGSITCSNISNGSGVVVDTFTIGADGTLSTDGTPIRPREQDEIKEDDDYKPISDTKRKNFLPAL